MSREQIERSQIQSKLEQIASAVRVMLVGQSEDEFLKAQCLDAAKALRDALNDADFDVTIIAGTFYVEHPDPENYSEWAVEDFDSDDAMEDAMHNATHYWLEVYLDGEGFLVDITASQFNSENDECGHMPDVFIGTYDDCGNYHRVNPFHEEAA